MNSSGLDPNVNPEVLFVAYLDGRLNRAEVDRLNQCLEKDPALREYAAHLVVQQVHLEELAQEHPELLTRTAQEPKVIPMAAVISGLREQWRWMAAAAAVAAALLLGIGFYLRSVSSLVLQQVTGVVKVHRVGQELTAASGLRIKPGDRLELQSGAVALVAYAHEATSLRLSDSAQLTINSVATPKAVSLQSGTLIATVAHQPVRHPMRLRTPQAEAIVLGTQFLLATHASATRLEVTVGRVQVTRLEDKASLVIEKGNFVQVRHGGPMNSEPLARGLLREFWLDTGRVEGTELANLRCLSLPPSGTENLRQFECPSDWRDGYVTRVRGWLQAPVTGEYRFWIAADDIGELWISSDERPEHKRKICWTTIWTGPREWDKRTTQQSPPIQLIAGGRYYLEAIHQEEAGGDGLAVGWVAPGRTREVVPGSVLIPAILSEREGPPR